MGGNLVSGVWMEETMGSKVKSWKERWGTGLRIMLTFRHRASFPVAVLWNHGLIAAKALTSETSITSARKLTKMFLSENRFHIWVLSWKRQLQELKIV